MVRIFGLSIPSGLEQLFANAVSIKTYTDFVNGGRGRTDASYYERDFMRSISLFVLWKDLWDGFDGGRKDAWTVYWGTLPFGAHTGGGNWPGSGYSAFVYVNAPRYKLGEDLLLDPPAGLGIENILNGDFSSGLDNWNADFFDNALILDGERAYYNFNGDTFGEAFLQQTLSINPASTYRLACDVEVQGADGNDVYLQLGISSENGIVDDERSIKQILNPGDILHLTQDILFVEDVPPIYITVWIENDGEDVQFWIDNISFREVL